MLRIIDYGVGNIFSIKCSLDYLGIESELTNDPELLLKSDRIILPGVGAFGDAMNLLTESKMDEASLMAAEKGIPILGICLGMQLMFEKSFEYGEYTGLGLIRGTVEDMNKLITDDSLSIPQMGWNALSFPKERTKSSIFKYVDEGSYVYFVHSYSGVDCRESIIATCDYSYPVTAAVERDNVFGVQFHPEKSGETGLAILKAFSEI